MLNFLLMMLIIPVIAIMLSRNPSLSITARKICLMIAFGSWGLYILPTFLNILWSVIIVIVLVSIIYLILTKVLK